MAAAVRSVGQYKLDNVSSGSAALPYPGTIGGGDLLGCIVWQDNDATIANLTAPSGWAQTGATISGNSAPFGKAFIRAAAATGSESGTIAWPVATGASTVAFTFAISGANVASPVSAALVAGYTSSASPVCPTVGSGSSPAAGDLLICSIAAQSGTPRTQTTPPTGMTQGGYQATTWNYALVDTQVLTTGGPTGTRTAVMSGTGSFCTLSIAIAQSASAPAAPTNLFMPFFQ